MATDDALRLQQGHYRKPSLSSSVQKKHSINTGDFGKENVERSYEDVVGRKTSVTNSPGFRPRKISDNSYDRPLRPRGLQEIDTFNSHVTVRRKEYRDVNATAKPFTKPLFSIYDDARDTRVANQRSEKTGNVKQKDEKPPQKSLGLREKGKNNDFTGQKNKENDGTTAGESGSSEKKSPENLPHISKDNILKIKEIHKKAPIMKRPPRVLYDIMSMELAYNIDYMCEYISYQMEINAKKKLSTTFLTKGVTADQRRLIVSYLITATTFYNYPSFILYQAVKIFDSYIDIVDVPLTELQASALASLWIALKKDLIIDDVPEASTIMQLAGELFEDKQPLIQSERKILMSLNFEISFAEPFSMLALYTVMMEEVRSLKSSKIQQLYYCGSYLIDLSLLHEQISDTTAMHLAVICAEIALVLIMTSNDDLNNPQWIHWRNLIFAANPSLDNYRLPDCEMNHIRNQLLQKVMLSKDRSSDFYVVQKKYKSKRYGAVSKFIISKVTALFLEKISDPLYTAHPILF